MTHPNLSPIQVENQQTISANAYPTALDYSYAIQTPCYCFQDEALRTGQPVCNALGLPSAISGNFATVFQIRGSQQNYAVRCFTHPLDGRESRYQAISDYLKTITIPALVSFEFLANGIKINGQWYPILKMPWVAGQTLEHFVATHLQETELLLNLAHRWAQLIAQLEQVHIAHGDLQHGNIILINDQFRLIDYDNLFVPALAGQISQELGHPNYQHPARTVNDFNAEADRFAAWVIYLSLIALALNPELWHLVRAGDDFLLLQQKDFLDPEHSLLLALLTTHEDERIKLPAKILEKALRDPVTTMPSVALLANVNSPFLTKERLEEVTDYLAEPLPLDTQITQTQTQGLEWLQWFQDAAQVGHAEAQYTLGWFYVQGQGVPQDFKQAVYWFQQAAKQGDRKAQYDLGQLYVYGQGVPRDIFKAAYWNLQAARQGHSQARQIFLRLFIQAAEQGSAEIQYTLALIYLSKKTYLKQGLNWLQRAAHRGHAEAQYQLACLHELGEDIPKQLLCALKWYKKAAWHGHRLALKRLFILWFNTLVKKFF